MLTSEEIFITDYEKVILDLYRFGNATHARFDNIRPLKDARIEVRLEGKKEVKYIMADGNGISVFSTFDPKKRNTWKIPKNTPLPSGVKLVEDKRPGHQNHYMLAPADEMRLSDFVDLLKKLITIKVS